MLGNESMPCSDVSSYLSSRSGVTVRPRVNSIHEAAFWYSSPFHVGVLYCRNTTRVPTTDRMRQSAHAMLHQNPRRVPGPSCGDYTRVR